MRQAERESGSRSIKMPSNENPFGPSPLAIAAIRQAANSTKLLSDNGANAMGCSARAENHGWHCRTKQNVDRVVEKSPANGSKQTLSGGFLRQFVPEFICECLQRRRLCHFFHARVALRSIDSQSLTDCPLKLKKFCDLFFREQIDL